MAAKFYAVRKGKKPGIYMSWDICKQQTDGFPGAEFKSFPTREAAEEYIGQKQQTVEKEPENYLNRLDVVEGRLPIQRNECVLVEGNVIDGTGPLSVGNTLTMAAF